MRKYFLASAVALMLISTANATQYGTGNIQAKAEVVRMINISCTPLDFGTIAVPSANDTSTVTISYNDGRDTISSTSDITIIKNGQSGKCTGMSFVDTYAPDMPMAEISYPKQIVLTSDDTTSQLNLSVSIGINNQDFSLAVGGTLEVPSNVEIGTYTGTIAISAIKE